MSERQAGYAPQDVAENSVRVNVQVQAASDEIEDLVAVIVGRLEGAGLELVRRDALKEDDQGVKTLELVLRSAL